MVSVVWRISCAVLLQGKGVAQPLRNGRPRNYIPIFGTDRDFVLLQWVQAGPGLLKSISSEISGRRVKLRLTNIHPVLGLRMRIAYFSSLHTTSWAVLKQALRQIYLNLTIFKVFNTSRTGGAECLVAASTERMPHCGKNMKFTGVHMWVLSTYLASWKPSGAYKFWSDSWIFKKRVYSLRSLGIFTWLI
jgi:hypothetical protein